MPYCIIHWHHLQINEVFLAFAALLSCVLSQIKITCTLHLPTIKSSDNFEENELRQITPDLFAVWYLTIMIWWSSKTSEQANERAQIWHPKYAWHIKLMNINDAIRVIRRLICVADKFVLISLSICSLDRMSDSFAFLDSQFSAFMSFILFFSKCTLTRLAHLENEHEHLSWIGCGAL